ncbi:hypothetical protein DFH08DRAFT_884978 [Mycena albidolilacea]|uniref:Uncharacterized protein n=1 Tax=Mycena albidolilacea TaxID=1033008 RepID=A0AAD6ZJS1_9AGAR|nr:hypothetical protein DFH08DRAFT_884978 [Mycena albidolilacea]
MGSPLTDAQSYGLFLESIFYGIYLVTCGVCLKTLLLSRLGDRLKPVRELNWAMLIVVFILFGVATVDAILQFYRNLHTFQIANGPGDAAGDFSNISDPINVVKSATVCIQTTIADMMLVYRCWVIYGRSWLVISLPGLLVLGNTAVTGVVLYLEITLNQHALLSVKQIKPFGAAFWALTIVINIITTGLIVARMWRINRGTQDIIYRPERRGPRPSTTLQHIMRIVIESGLLYTGTSLITFISYVTNSVAVYVTTDIEIQVIGIAFNLIIIRAALSPKESYSITSGSGYPLEFRMSSQSTAVPSTRVNVSITQQDDREDKTSDKPGEF